MTRNGVTAPKGFLATGIKAGIKKGKKKELALIYSELPCALAGVTTQNKVVAAPIILARETITRGRGQAIIINSGNANAGTGQDGLKRAAQARKALAKELNLAEEDVVVASTGIIGVPWPSEKIIKVFPKLIKNLSIRGGLAAAQAILTTDLFTKQIAIPIRELKATIGGMAKGSGMIHPNMATMLAFLTTDLAIDPIALQRALWEVVELTFNMISVDGDTSTNDMVMIMANGAKQNKVIRVGTRAYELFKESLLKACNFLAQAIIKDGEGAKKIFEVQVKGAAHKLDAKKVAKTIITSPLIKTAIAGGDNNWGRVVAAVGRSGAMVNPEKIKVEMKGLKTKSVKVMVNLNIGNAEAKAWGCDLTNGYIKINTHYN
ncbi:MAG: bifunctional glutamate N-acetyltransferase/amino-acid acetyltransferase ArgJ [Candidatus Margulisbacteria bacterium]|nr:bifunctional glutamate N-acetyltransferase/amino-acid acetyltransferase ArgJ [Candidatus Margulisiibacteriota bacterium]